jgi:HNH endonuclease
MAGSALRGFKRAGFRCELCGVSADERAFEVDHIVPREHGDEDDVTNLQALCFKCNANKTRDDQDFRVVREGINKLSGLPSVEEVNFWAHSIPDTQPGELFLFKPHAPRNFIVGGGVFARSDILPVFARLGRVWHG